MFDTIGREPYLGQPHSTLTRIVGTEVRSRLSQPYRIYYRVDGTAPEIIAILHTSRDTNFLLAERFQ